MKKTHQNFKFLLFQYLISGGKLTILKQKWQFNNSSFQCKAPLCHYRRFASFTPKSSMMMLSNFDTSLQPNLQVGIINSHASYIVHCYNLI